MSTELMKRAIAVLLLFVAIWGCNSPNNEKIKLEQVAKFKNQDSSMNGHSPCFLTDPDTSLSGIKLRDPESTISLLNETAKLRGDSTYAYYSKLENETLFMTVHPGDYLNQVSIFRVKYSDKADHGYKELRNDYFASEKGIRLGLTKKQIIEKIGSCYLAKDSDKDYIELYYRLELPQDSKTKLLQRQNMPVYYASYKLWNDKLEDFEFGFEYP